MRVGAEKVDGRVAHMPDQQGGWRCGRGPDSAERAAERIHRPVVVDRARRVVVAMRPLAADIEIHADRVHGAVTGFNGGDDVGGRHAEPPQVAGLRRRQEIDEQVTPPALKLNFDYVGVVSSAVAVTRLVRFGAHGAPRNSYGLLSI